MKNFKRNLELCSGCYNTDPIIRPLCELDGTALRDILPEIPIWVDWLNKFISEMWPYLDKPRVDFGLKILGGDIMSIPGLYRFVQETIRKEVANLYLWPQFLEIPVIDASTLATSKTVGILHDTSSSDPQSSKNRGTVVVELTYNPFKEDSDGSSGPLDADGRNESINDRALGNESPNGAGVLLVTVQGAEDVEGKHHNNPYALVLFRGERKKSKVIKKTRDPIWNEEFQFMLEEPLVSEKIHIQVMSKRSSLSLQSKESLGHVDISLPDVVHDGRINEKYHLIDSKNGMIHVELEWKTICEPG
ncbi:synaptotagmin-3-like [Cornus florida]|uniref:synaptotagmin-3-like n=1 Tax=Cornus florida TaxID=4283 RepID=UPI0028A2AF9E|nr:synaptotagmin-3-like [Cornus florida]